MSAANVGAAARGWRSSGGQKSRDHSWQMADDLCDAHDRHIFRADYALEAGIDHARSAHSHESRGLANRVQLPFEFLDEQCTVVLTAGFTSRDEDAWRARTFVRRLVPALAKKTDFLKNREDLIHR